MLLLHFKLQVPLTPLRKPDEMLIPSDSRMPNSFGYEGTCNEPSVPTMITWSYGGKEVAVEGSWDLWKTRFSSLLFLYHLEQSIIISDLLPEYLILVVPH